MVYFVVMVGKDYIQSHSGDQVDFCFWQGGEPTLAGLASFEKVVKSPKSNLLTAKRQLPSIVYKTNAIAINRQWAHNSFADNHFLLGVSIDGIEAVHDAKYRISVNGSPTFPERVKRAINLLNEYGVEFNTLNQPL